jgi:nucleoside-diphosphate-sugar epimerase
MKVLLTGATGFVGRYVVQELISQNIDFVTVGRSAPPSDNEHINVDLLALDDFGQIIQQAKATHLIHLAWYTEYGKYWSSPLNLDWVKATSLLVEAFCQKGGKHITIAGTCAEYDWSYGYCDEDLTPANPSTIYGIAKDATRRLSQAICKQYKIPLAWGRIFFPYGKGEPVARLIPSLFFVFNGEKVPFPVSLDSFRDFLHANDVASALVMLSTKEVNTIINISSGTPISIKEIIIMIAAIEHADPHKILSLNTSQAVDSNILVGRNEKLRDLGWCEAIKIEEGLKATK